MLNTTRMITILVIASAMSSVFAKDKSQYGWIDGTLVKRADPNLYPVHVVSVDGKFHPKLPTMMQLEPGFHWLQVASGKVGRRGDVTYKPLPLNVEPCTTYFVSAKHEPGMSNREWEIVATGTHVRTGCESDISKSDTVKDGL